MNIDIDVYPDKPWHPVVITRISLEDAPRSGKIHRRHGIAGLLENGELSKRDTVSFRIAFDGIKDARRIIQEGSQVNSGASLVINRLLDMSPLNGSQQSTPCKNPMASKFQSGNQEYRQDQIKHELEVDLQGARRCGFDDLLKHFFYLIMNKDCPEKQTLDDLQSRIEVIQSGRYYNKVNHDDAGQAPVTDVVDESERLGEGPEDPSERTLDEKNLIEQRDGILDKLLNDAIEEVLPIANDDDMKDFLLKFEAELKHAERKRYAPYVELCNGALHRLFNAGRNLPIRSADKLDIRFQVNDPNLIPSHYGKGGIIERKPDVIVSSSAALGQRKHTEANPSVRLCTVLSCHEFKIHSTIRPQGTEKIVDLKNHEYKMADILEETSHAQLHYLDVAIGQEDNAEPSSQVTAGAKRIHDVANLDIPEGQPPVKKRVSTGSRANSNTNPDAQQKANKKPDTQKDIEGRVQCASYALEMLSYCAGVHHAINILFTDGIFWIWYYDRQGVLQSSGVSIFYDFPRFLLLLLIFQRFSLEDWGVIQDFNPEAKLEHSQRPAAQKPQPVKSTTKKDTHPDRKGNPSPPVVVALPGGLENWHDYPDFRQKGNPKVEMSHIKLNMNEYLSYRPHCLAGRATAVVAAKGFLKDTNQEHEMVCKLYHPEIQRRNEGLTMKVIYQIVKEDMVRASKDEERSNLGIPSMANYLPQFYFCADVKGTATHRIRSMVNCRWKGHRVMRIIGMKKLKKITTLRGWDFVKAWLQGMVCHAFLWQNFVEHGDPSLSNIMYDEDTGCGVLTDFDLSLLQWEHRIFGTDRTGTVPFMAIEILTKQYWAGKSKHYYHHELESFIWMLPYVFLLYQDTKRQTSAIVEPWITSSYQTCCAAKSHFLLVTLPDFNLSKVQLDFKPCWPVASSLCSALLAVRARSSILKIGAQNEALENTDLEDYPEDDTSDAHSLDDASDSSNGPNLGDAASISFNQSTTLLWDAVQVALNSTVKRRFKDELAGLQFFKPGFGLSNDEAEKLRNKFKNILQDCESISSQPTQPRYDVATTTITGDDSSTI